VVLIFSAAAGARHHQRLFAAFLTQSGKEREVFLMAHD
jgi:hypothetical protein